MRTTLNIGSNEKRIYRLFSLIILCAGVAFLALRLFKLSRADSEINLSVELIRVSVNFGLLIVLSPIAVHTAKAIIQRKKYFVPIALLGLLIYLSFYALVNNLVNYLINTRPEYDAIKTVRKLVINFGHIALLSFLGVMTVAYWSLKKYSAKYILLKNLHGTHNKVKLDDIVLVKSDDHYQKIYTKNGFFYVRGTISQFHKKLDDQRFKRVHRSAIANLSEIDQLTPKGNGGFHLLMSNGEEVKVSRSFKDEIKNYLKEAGTK